MNTKGTPAERPFPLPPLLGAAALVITSILLVAGTRLFDDGASSGPPPAIVVSRDLFFEDLDDGSVAILEANDRLLIDVLEPGTNGFLRATLRGLARGRKAMAAGPEQPFRLQLTEHGRLLLVDPVTSQEVDLW
ncbi:MAG TPA: photosynthetic complex assembly protein PuhC, partial [Woeseiaceae bacterium]